MTDPRQIKSRPSEAEIFELYRKAKRQYEECIHLAELADISDMGEDVHPRYAWDNPIGLTVVES